LDPGLPDHYARWWTLRDRPFLPPPMVSFTKLVGWPVFLCPSLLAVDQIGAVSLITILRSPSYSPTTPRSAPGLILLAAMVTYYRSSGKRSRIRIKPFSVFHFFSALFSSPLSVSTFVATHPDARSPTLTR